MPDDRATRGGGPAECRCPLASPNDVWCADLKGEFKLGNGHYCYLWVANSHLSGDWELKRAATVLPPSVTIKRGRNDR
jgi:hypothetical protein